MGAAIGTQYVKLADNELLKRLSGLEPVTDNDPLWNQLLSFNIDMPRTRPDAQALEDAVQDYKAALRYNAPTTGNLAALVRVFLRRADELAESAQCDNKIFMWQTTNALRVLRHCLQHCAQHLPEEQLLQLFSTNVLRPNGDLEQTQSTTSAAGDGEAEFTNLADEFVAALLRILTEVPVTATSAEVHIETVLTLTALLSAQLFYDRPIHSTLWLRYLMRSESFTAANLLKALLSNFVLSNLSLLEPENYDGGGSFVLGIAASMANVVRWGFTGWGEHSTDQLSALGNYSLLLVLLLVNQCSGSNQANPFRISLFSFTNAQEKVGLPAVSSTQASSFKLDYSRLYDVLAARCCDDSPLMLLYLLLHQNVGYRNYVLSRVNIETLVLPVLRVLYDETTHSSSNHLYLSLVVMLILTEDDFFCKVIHETVLRNVDWCFDRNFSEITLGSLIVLVLIRTIQVNIVKVRDRYLHSNCLAALANMSSHFKRLHPFVCQKLIALLEALRRRHQRATEHLRLQVQLDLTTANGVSKETPGVHTDTLGEDISALEDGIRTLLEILNCCLANTLHHNPHLVYTMLHKRELFESLRQESVFEDIMQNIDQVLTHFSVRLKAAPRDATSSDYLSAIAGASMQWTANKLKKFPDLKFKYVEDENTEAFFVPYAWMLVYKHADLFWEPSAVKLFNATSITRV